MIALNLTQLGLILPPLILIEGFFAGSEIALLSADKISLKKQSKQGDFRSTLALKLASQPEKILSATLLISSLCVIGISSLISIYFLENSYKHSHFLAILVASPLIVLFGELIPKTVYQKNATRWAPWVAYPIHLTYWTFFPVTRLIAAYTTRLSRIVSPIEELLAGRKRTTREEIQDLLSYTKKETEIKASEKKMIRRIFDFRYSEAKHALIPLVRVEAVSESALIQEALESFERHRHSRMPVYSGRIDNIIGILEVSDLFPASELSHPIRHYVTPALYVAETQSLEDLLKDMRREDSEMVVVVDEHGGAVGILTLEDILEEIVGEISDEFDYEALPYKEVSQDSWVVQARMEIQQINEVLKLDLPEGNYETLSGFLLQQFGRIPEIRDELFFDTPAGSFKFSIQKATERHIETVFIQKL